MKYYNQVANGAQDGCNPHTAIQFFMKSKIGKEKIEHIYRICNQDPRIPIKPRVFCVVFHIIQLVRKGFEIPRTPKRTCLCYDAITK